MITANAVTGARCLRAPAPGVYRGVPAEEYHRWDAASSSRLTCIKDESAGHMRHKIDNGDEDTDAKMRGTLIHAAMLEPDRYDKEYAIGPDVNLSTKVGKEEWGKFAAANVGKSLVRGKDGEKIIGMRRSIWCHPLARNLLLAKGGTEVSAVFVEKESGVLCKLRVDKVVEGKNLCIRFVDLKKTTEGGAGSSMFANKIVEYGYHRQGALYMHGMATLGTIADYYDIIAVEDVEPYAVAVHRLSDDLIKMGWDEAREALSKYKQCDDAKMWPFYGFDWNKRQYQIMQAMPPRWYRERHATDR